MPRLIRASRYVRSMRDQELTGQFLPGGAETECCGAARWSAAEQRRSVEHLESRFFDFCGPVYEGLERRAVIRDGCPPPRRRGGPPAVGIRHRRSRRA